MDAAAGGITGCISTDVSCMRLQCTLLGACRMKGYRHSILFLCTANASRSQLAEAIARANHGDILEVHSAGSRPAGWVHPLATRAMQEIGVDTTGQRSKGVTEFARKEFDMVVTLCTSAAKDCPTWPGARRVINWDIEDPSFGDDDPETRYLRFRQTRDELIWKIAELVADLREEIEPHGTG
jgi:arsenate reductase